MRRGWGGDRECIPRSCPHLAFIEFFSHSLSYCLPKRGIPTPFRVGTHKTCPMEKVDISSVTWHVIFLKIFQKINKKNLPHEKLKTMIRDAQEWNAYRAKYFGKKNVYHLRRSRNQACIIWWAKIAPVITLESNKR